MIARFYRLTQILILFFFLNGITSCTTEKLNSNTSKPHLKALIIDGQNNHYIWPKTTQMIKDYLEQTDLFEVDIYRTDSIWLGIKYNQSRPVPLDGYLKAFPVDSIDRAVATDPIKTSNLNIDFKKYNLIVSNLGAFIPHWPQTTKKKFEQYMKQGGGLVIIHAANNAWGDWKSFNKMIGLGAWGDRDSLTGPYVYYDEKDKIQVNPAQGVCATHGLEHEYIVTTRAPEHPIMKGLPAQWLHSKDELYDRMRGPFENTTILATAFSDTSKNEQPWEPVMKGTGWHVPTLLAIAYEQGRVFHTTLGHFDYSMECLGFITTLQRGAEWAATGAVTQKIPEEFPGREAAVVVKWKGSEIAEE